MSVELYAALLVLVDTERKKRKEGQLLAMYERQDGEKRRGG
jgi:hypothetical protein